MLTLLELFEQENQLPVIVADHDNGVAFYSKYACQ